MKKNRLLAMLCLLGILYLQCGRTAYVNLATTQNTEDGYVLYLTITANKLFIIDEEQCAKSLIQQTLDNDFKNMLFSYDKMGLPKEIRIQVYTNRLEKLHHTPAFEVHYNTSSDGIKIILKEQSSIKVIALCTLWGSKSFKV